MKKAFILITAMNMAALLLAGCQTTPDKPAVIQKDMEQMIEKAAETGAVSKAPDISLKERVKAPEKLVLTTQKGNFTLTADAAVSVPDAAKMPIIRVKAGEFTQQQVTAYWSALVGDTVLYENQTELTKSEIQDTIVAYKKSLSRDKDEPGYAEVRKETEADIAYLESIYPSAPEKIERKRADSTLKKTERKDLYSGQVNGWYMGTGGNTPGYTVGFQVQNRLKDGTGRIDGTARMTFGTADQNYNYGQKNTLAVDEDTKLEKSLAKYIKTTPAEAKKLVSDFLEKTGTPMKIASMRLVNDEETGAYDGKVAPAEHYAYTVTCFRVVDGVLPSASILGGTYVESEDPNYTKTWEYETLSFMVNDKGIISVEWSAPLELLETKVEDSKLMPFSEIQGIFEKMMPVTYETQTKGMDGLTCNIEEVRLEMMRIVEQGSIENGLLIPVWNFYGTRSSVYKGKKEDETGKYILLSVNAVDGSIISISKGY
jgi:hypothetical protein